MATSLTLGQIWAHASDEILAAIAAGKSPQAESAADELARRAQEASSEPTEGTSHGDD